LGRVYERQHILSPFSHLGHVWCGTSPLPWARHHKHTTCVHLATIYKYNQQHTTPCGCHEDGTKCIWWQPVPKFKQNLPVHTGHKCEQSTLLHVHNCILHTATCKRWHSVVHASILMTPARHIQAPCLPHHAVQGKRQPSVLSLLSMRNFHGQNCSVSNGGLSNHLRTCVPEPGRSCPLRDQGWYMCDGKNGDTACAGGWDGGVCC
jgi:hypothetical protein